MLGSVTGLVDPQVGERCGEMGGAHPAPPRFVAPDCDASPMLQLREQVSDMVALGVDRLVPGRRVHHAELGWGVDGAALSRERGAQLGRHAATVEGGVPRGDARDEGRCVAQAGVLAGVLAGAQAGARHEPQDAARAVCAGMELAAQPAMAAAARWPAPRKLRAVLSYRVAMALNCLSLAKKFSTGWRSL